MDFKLHKCLLFLCSLFAFTTLAQAEEEDYYMPEELENAKIYVEKFSPIYIQDISEEDITRIAGEKKSKNDMSEFLEFLKGYNLVFYRKLNEYIETNILAMKNPEKFVPMYERDFHETSDTGIRFFIKNDFSIVDVYAERNRTKWSSELENTFSYYILDKQTGNQYKGVVDIKELLMKVDYLYTLHDKNKLDRLTRDDLHKSIESIKPEKNKRKISGPTWSVFFFSGLTLVLNFLLNA